MADLRFHDINIFIEKFEITLNTSVRYAGNNKIMLSSSRCIKILHNDNLIGDILLDEYTSSMIYRGRLVNSYTIKNFPQIPNEKHITELVYLFLKDVVKNKFFGNGYVPVNYLFNKLNHSNRRRLL